MKKTWMGMVTQLEAFRSKKELVYDALLKAILSGRLKPGQRLIIDEMARELNVSPIPVREALQLLQADGFVLMRTHIGAVVASLEPGAVSEIFSLLETLEVISGRAACQRMSEADCAAMEEQLRLMDTLQGEVEEWARQNIHLHELISHWAGTHLVETLMPKVLSHWNRLCQIYLKEVFVHRISLAQQEHWELLAAMRTRNPDTVEELVRRHNREALAAYTQFIQSAS